ncbi:hypothetical protein MPHL43072_16625 [Mycolicibacterium phlei DSM 43072]|uniref:DUF937 domain-containing protein n=2 Tax=Mycolicibacterium phlei TaxID=1771 RepID=A0A5N5USC8_MYCPH|nr:hypothetical protein MPHL21000_25850 [Mycolicibacterium phlei DSM 43239 = CCUG 21000]KXW61672.1 hypothetical protein MPHL43239_20765 [Mycolicibacterium phlei DSM 43239 = CCUG 21000]KXW71222.1 hypothetical protein MPHL43072_16625 [Mycolicibacterium phlei DSM 43072]KXW73069.1 hypothetical protein MPHL43070_12850 [Mycolicibacterium phlei DSM 43070]MBF4192734.1 hypothetical protein [Mycolicibacterium phlei]
MDDMADLDDLFNQIPVQEIAGRLNADENEVNSAIRTLVPVLVGGLQHNAADPDTASGIAKAADTHAGLLDGGVSVDQVDEADGAKAVAKIFGGTDTNQVASALAGGGAGNSDLIQKLLPILTPIVLAYIGKQLTGRSGGSGESGGGLADILGGILGGGSGGGGGDNPLGSILGSVLGGGKGGGLGDILGGLLGGRK